MELEKPKRTLASLTDDEIESCFDGSSDIDLVRRLLIDNLAPDGWVWAMDFGHSFAEAIEGFIGAEEGTDEWDESWNVNQEWGENIADNVNELLSQEKG